MRKLELIGHHDGLGLTELCIVTVDDEPHPVNGANHHYTLYRAADRNSDPFRVGHVQFQRGPRNEPGSTPGTLDGAVLQILIHRLESFQAGPFASAENAVALVHLKCVAGLLITRAQERAARGVLGKDIK